MSEDAPNYSSFQNEIYFAGMGGETPSLPMTYDAMVERAREEFTPGAFGYVAGGAGHERTMDGNRRAFDRWEIMPRMLTDVSTRDLTTSVLGHDLATPVVLGPVGVLSIVHDEAEKAVARAAAEVGVPMTLSTVSSFTMEDVAEANGDGTRWFQLYWPSDRDLTASLLDRAEAAGYSAIVVTLDTKILAWRPRDLETAYLPFLQGEGLANYFSDPAFLAPLDESPEEDFGTAILHWVGLFLNRGATWEDLAFIREHTDLPIVLKGVLHPDDARRAADSGCEGIVVSNHGGRQVDGSVASMDALPGVVDAVGDELDVLLDSGIRNGADVFKALALGADAVMLGRPYVWGLGLGGADGVKHVVRGLLADLDLTLTLSGFPNVSELSRDCLVRADSH